MPTRFLGPLLPLTLLLGFGSCASDSGPRKAFVVALGASTTVQHDYEASVSPTVWSPELEEFEMDEGDLSGSQFVHLRVHTAIMTNEEIEGLVGTQYSGSWAIRADRLPAESAFHRLEGGDERLVTVRPGQTGASTVINQSAFIERFEIKSSPQQLAVDPVVEVACDGLMLRIKGTPTAGTDALQIEATVEHHTLTKPIQEVEIQLPQALMPVSIQQPVTTHQVMRFAESLGPGDAIIGGIPLVGKPLRMHVFMVTADLRDVSGKRVPSDE